MEQQFIVNAALAGKPFGVKQQDGTYKKAVGWMQYKNHYIYPIHVEFEDGTVMDFTVNGYADAIRSLSPGNLVMIPETEIIWGGVTSDKCITRFDHDKNQMIAYHNGGIKLIGMIKVTFTGNDFTIEKVPL